MSSVHTSWGFKLKHQYIGSNLTLEIFGLTTITTVLKQSVLGKQDRWGLQNIVYVNWQTAAFRCPLLLLLLCASVLYIYAFTSRSKTRRFKHDSHSIGQHDEKWNDLPSAEMLATSVSIPLVNKGAEGWGEGRGENNKEMSASCNIQQAKLQYRLRLSQAPLKNDGPLVLYWLGG